MSRLVPPAWSGAAATALLFTSCLSAGSGVGATPIAAVTAGDQGLTLRVGGLERRYIVHVPQGYDGKRRLPVVVMLHGGGGSARGAMQETGWPAKADATGVLAVFPDAMPPNPSLPSRFLTNPQTWNDGSGRGTSGRLNIDDVGFIRALLEDVEHRFSVDASRVYVTGHSNGASMTYSVAAQLADRVAAVAPVSGHLWLADPKPGRAVPLLVINGAKDPLNPLEGGEVRLPWGTVERHPPVAESVRRWAALNECGREPQTTYDKDGVTEVAYEACRDGAEVLFYTVEGQGHGWPGGTSLLPEQMIGPAVNTLNATDVIWDFFSRHTLPAQPVR